MGTIAGRILCQVGLHCWYRRVLPPTSAEEDMLDMGYPVPCAYGERYCYRGCGA